MNAIVNTEKKKLHPYKFTLWVAIGSIVMMFAGLTSAYIVKREQPGWQELELPSLFIYSTVVILASSVTMHLALKNYRSRSMSQYKMFMTITAILGLFFIGLQWEGFAQLKAKGFPLSGNVAGSFIYVITSVHMLHVLGGVVALVAMFLRAFSAKQRNYSVIPIEVTAMYWHFVDILWIYLFVFFNLIK